MSTKETTTYNEGDLVAVPLENGRCGVVLVARRQARRRYGVRQVYLYILGRTFDRVPSLAEVADWGISDAVGFAHTGDATITSGRWPAIGPKAEFSHEAWPVLPFFSGEGRYLCWLDNDDLSIVYLPIDIINEADRKHFRIEWCTANLTWVEGVIPDLVARSEKLFSREDLAAWERYRGKVLESVPRAKKRPY